MSYHNVCVHPIFRNNLLAKFIACVLEVPVPVLRSELILVHMLQE